MHARHLCAQEVAQVLRAGDDSVEPPGGSRAGADVAQRSVSKDLDDQFGGKVQELGRHESGRGAGLVFRVEL